MVPSNQKAEDSSNPRNIENNDARIHFIYGSLLGEQVNIFLKSTSPIIPDSALTGSLFHHNNMLQGVLQFFVPPLPKFDDEIPSDILSQQAALGRDCLVLAGAQWVPVNSKGAKSSKLQSMVIPMSDIDRLSGKCVDDDSAMECSKFKTDQEISRVDGHERVDGNEKPLQAWQPVDGEPDKIVEWGGNEEFKGWDQFSTNKELFNFSCTYDDTLYTTAMELKMHDEKDIARAKKLAEEIECYKDKDRRPFNDAVGFEEAQFGAVAQAGDRGWLRGVKGSRAQSNDQCGGRQETVDQISSLMVRHKKKQPPAHFPERPPTQRAQAPNWEDEAVRDDLVKQLNEINQTLVKVMVNSPERCFELGDYSSSVIARVYDQEARGLHPPNTAIGGLIKNQRLAIKEDRSINEDERSSRLAELTTHRNDMVKVTSNDSSECPAVIKKLKGQLGTKKIDLMIRGSSYLFLDEQMHLEDLNQSPSGTSRPSADLVLDDRLPTTQPVPFASVQSPPFDAGFNYPNYSHLAAYADTPWRGLPTSIESPHSDDVGCYKPGNGFVLMFIPAPAFDSTLPTEGTAS
eukprot:GHVH01006374.1.p1 GENE.GHVH01006374.1~~GHVH01006374.1.p1  ORF type:complete len:602 (+),score=102.32 GHVH01006374.1:93-1808(+)